MEDWTLGKELCTLSSAHSAHTQFSGKGGRGMGRSLPPRTGAAAGVGSGVHAPSPRGHSTTAKPGSRAAGVSPPAISEGRTAGWVPGLQGRRAWRPPGFLRHRTQGHGTHGSPPPPVSRIPRGTASPDKEPTRGFHAGENRSQQGTLARGQDEDSDLAEVRATSLLPTPEGPHGAPRPRSLDHHTPLRRPPTGPCSRPSDTTARPAHSPLGWQGAPIRSGTRFQRGQEVSPHRAPEPVGRCDPRHGGHLRAPSNGAHLTRVRRLCSHTPAHRPVPVQEAQRRQEPGQPWARTPLPTGAGSARSRGDGAGGGRTEGRERRPRPGVTLSWTQNRDSGDALPGESREKEPQAVHKAASVGRGGLPGHSSAPFQPPKDTPCLHRAAPGRPRYPEAQPHGPLRGLDATDPRSQRPPVKGLEPAQPWQDNPAARAADEEPRV